MDLARLILVQEALEDWGKRKAEKPHEVLPVAYSSARLCTVKAAAGMPLEKFSKSLWGQHTDPERYGDPIQAKRVIRDWLKGERTMTIDILWAIITKALGLNWISAGQALTLHLDLLERKAVITALRPYLKRVRNRADYRMSEDPPYKLAEVLATEVAARITLKCKSDILLVEDPAELRRCLALYNPDRDIDLLLLNVEIEQWKHENFVEKTSQAMQAAWFSETSTLSSLSEWHLQRRKDGTVNEWIKEGFDELGLAVFCHTGATLTALKPANTN